MNDIDKYFNSYKEGVKNVPFDNEEIKMKFFKKSKYKFILPIIIGLITFISSISYYLVDDNVEVKNKQNIVKLTNTESEIIKTEYKHVNTDDNVIIKENTKSKADTIISNIDESDKIITYRDENKIIKIPFDKKIVTETKMFSSFALVNQAKYSDPDELILNKSSNSSIAGVIIPVINEDEAKEMMLNFDNEIINFKFLTKDILAKNSLLFNKKYKNSSKSKALLDNNYPASLDSIEILQDIYIELDLLDKLLPMGRLADSLEIVDYTDEYKQIKLINYNLINDIKNDIPIPYLIAFKLNNLDYEHQIYNRNFNGINYKIDGLDKELQLIPIVIKINQSKYLNSIVAWYPISKQLANKLPERYKRILEYELEILENNSKELCEKIPEQNFLGVCSNNLKNIEINNIYLNSSNSELNLNLTINLELRINIKVYDMLGKEVGSYLNERVNKGSFNKRLNLNGLNKGIYILELTSENGDYLTKRFITN